MTTKRYFTTRVIALSIGCTLGATVAAVTTSRAEAPTVTATTASASTAAAPSTKEQIVEVRLTEYAIEMPRQLSAGRTRFKVTNAGDMFHRFEIEGKGIEVEIEAGVDEGQTKTLDVDLQPGSYEVYCPVRGHKKAGMFLRVEVT